jgi:hypothetical protein
MEPWLTAVFGARGSRSSSFATCGSCTVHAKLTCFIHLDAAWRRVAGRHAHALCALALAGVGAGVGLCWPHLLTRVLTLALPGEGGIASAAITTVQLYGMATGAAVAGLIANAAGC